MWIYVICLLPLPMDEIVREVIYSPEYEACLQA